MGALAQHAVEFVDEEGDGLVALVSGDGGVHVGAVDGQVAFGGEAMGDVLFGVAFQFDAQTDDAFLVAEEPVNLFVHELL